MSVPAPAAPYDPYAEKPPGFFERHAEYVWAAAVFVATVFLTVMCFPRSQASAGAEFAYAFASPAVFWAYTRPRFKLYAWTLFTAQAVAWTVLLAWLHHVTWGGLFLLGPFVGTWVGLWYVAAWWAMPRMIGRSAPLRIFGVLGLAALWVLIEWTRTWLFSGFPWLPLAASQWQRMSILQIAAYTGAGGISFVLVAMNVAFAAYAHRLFREKLRGLRRRSQEFFFAMFLLLVCLAVHVQETFRRFDFHVPLARVALVQPYIPQQVKWDPSRAGGIIETVEQVTVKAATGRTRPDLIVWPEAVTPWPIRGHAEMQRWTEELSRKVKAPILAGTVWSEATPESSQPRWYNGAVVIDPQAGLLEDTYAKRRLVPFGEFVPLRPLLGWLEKVTDVGEGDFTPGASSAPLTAVLPEGPVAFAPLICYEDIFPQASRQAVLAGAEVLVVMTNNGWFGEGAAAYQHAAHAVLRAVETRRPVLRCGNGGWSGWIDEFGMIRHVLLQGDEDGPQTVYFRGGQTVAVTRDQRWMGRQSFYVQHGDWFLFFCVALVGFGWAALAIGKVQPVETPDDQSAPI